MLACSASLIRQPVWPLALLAAALALVLVLHGAIPQWAGYHAFADARAWLGLPNAQNVLSNLPFLIVGLLGWHAAAGVPAWRCFGAAVAATAFGSALYHWAPGNAALVADRLPIAWACAALGCALLVATGSVAWWWFGEQRGAGDLRAYLFVQFLPMLLVPAALLLRLRLLHAGAVPDRSWWAVLALYAGAKLTELADQQLLNLLGFTSGHTLKHLLAAAAAACLVGALRSGSRR